MNNIHHTKYSVILYDINKQLPASYPFDEGCYGVKSNPWLDIIFKGYLERC